MTEGIADRATDHFNKVGMPKGKQKHSLRVMKYIKNATDNKDAHMAALFHDYLEKGGDINMAWRMFRLSPRVTNVVRHLSDPEKMDSDETVQNGPLIHIQAVLNDASITPDEKAIVILVKIADRLDNLSRRIKAGGVSRGYSLKSHQLLDFLFNYYTSHFGKDEGIKKMFRQLKVIDSQIKRPLGLQKPWKQNQVQVPIYNPNPLG